MLTSTQTYRRHGTDRECVCIYYVCMMYIYMHVYIYTHLHTYYLCMYMIYTYVSHDVLSELKVDNTKRSRLEPTN